MNYKVLAIGVALGFVMALSPSCSATPTCDTTNCNGCCAADGTCIAAASTNATQCGASGLACKACAATEQCSAGACVTTQPDAGSAPDAGKCPGCTTGCCTSNGICLPGKSSSNCGAGGATCSPCATGQSCDSAPTNNGGVCKTPVEPDAGPYGNACTMDTECADIGTGATCRLQTAVGGFPYPGGYCTKECGNSQCGTGATCVGVAQFGENDICAKNCDSSHPCRSPGYTCHPLQSGGGVCWLFPLPPPPDAGQPAPDNLIGSACTTAAECNDAGFVQGDCFPAALPDGGPAGWTDGYCVGDCSIDPNICGATANCFGLNSGSGTLNVCLDLCAGPGTGQGNCRTGYVCDSFTIRLTDGGTAQATDGVCWPNCHNPGWGCGTGQTCDPQGYCVQ